VLAALIDGHVEVVLNNLDIARTFLNEARMLDREHRARVIEARDHYEGAFREVLRVGAADGSFRDDVDPKTDTIFILSILNAVERWYNPAGELNRADLVDKLTEFVQRGLIR
jgi:hypothetical protein